MLLVTNIATPEKNATFVGTEGNLAPENLDTPAADICSLGKVFYEACTGRDRQDSPLSQAPSSRPATKHSLF